MSVLKVQSVPYLPRYGLDKHLSLTVDQIKDLSLDFIKYNFIYGILFKILFGDIFVMTTVDCWLLRVIQSSYCKDLFNLA